MNHLRTRGVRQFLALMIVLAIFVVSTRTAAGAIVASTTVGNGGIGITSLSWSHNVAAGANRLLVVRVNNINSSVTVSTVTYGGAALTQLATAVDRNSTTASRASLYYLVAPAVGAASVVVTLSASARVIAGSQDFTGVSQAAPFGTVIVASGNSTAASVTLTGSSSDMFVDVVSAQGTAGAAISAGTGQTGAVSYTGQTSSDVVGMGSTKAGGASSNMTWSYGGSAPWVGIGVPLKAGGPTVGGTVFEDSNYGGGAGRSLAASSGAGMSGATVELYGAAGSLVATTTSAANGSYSFADVPAGSYFVRVVTSTVQSTRIGSATGLWPVQTWRYEASWQTPAAVTSEVGGARPDVADSAAAPALAWSQCATESGGSSNPCAFTGTRLVRFGTGSTWTTRVATGGVTCSNVVFGDPAPGSGKTCEVLQPHLHSASSVYVGASDVTGLDFGFNFDTVVNTNDSGQGSLRQAIVNANALGGDSSLAQSGRAAGIENLAFMIGNGSSAAGLRTAYNFFGTSAGSYNAATITPASVFPTMTSPIVIDAQSQPGWSANPIVEINGNGLTSTLLRFSGGNSTLRGFVINRLAGSATSAVRLDTAGGNTVQGNWLGPDVAGATATTAQRVPFQMEVYSGANTIGGTTAVARNVISNGGSNGIVIWGGSANVVQGNYIGTNAAGTAALGNGDSGIVLPPASTATGTVIGGVNAGEGNVISGNVGNSSPTGGIAIQGSGTTGTLIRGNSVGLNAQGTGAIASGGYGIYVASANTTIGGTAAGAGNTITGYGSKGIAVVGGTTTGVTIEGNAIYGNTGIGIDLANDNATPNDGAKTLSQPNLLMDTPVFTAASVSGSSLAVSGYVGSAANQLAFGLARVEVFISDASSANGQGKTYLGYLTAGASGTFSGTITGVTGVVNGSTRITGTATDTLGNTSEFGPNTTASAQLSGTVFEDTNYGGGAGRSLSGSGSGAAGVANAVVELYNALGTYVSSTTTASGGTYSFGGLAAGSYYVRVVGGTVQSQRAGSIASLAGVLTYRTDASSGTATAVTNYVGGTNPSAVDPGSASSGAAFLPLTLVYGAGLSGTAQNVTPVLLAGSAVSGLDFGFNFDTVVNTNDSGAGSLRQAITNANTLGGDGALAQSGRPAAIENLVFMLGNGTTGSGGSLGLSGGLRIGVNQFGTSAGAYNVATITPASALPLLSTAMVIDAQAQPGWTAKPLIELNGASAGNTHGLQTTAAGNVVRGLVVNRFAVTGIYLNSASNTVQGCWVGLNAAGTAASANAWAGVYVTANSNTVGGTSATQRNVVSGNGFGAGTSNAGILVSSGSGNVIQGNYVGLDAGGSAAVPNLPYGLDITGTSTTIGGTATGAGNVMSGNSLDGIIVRPGADGATLQGNTVGARADNSAVVANGRIGIDLQANAATVGGTAAGAANIVRGNVTGGVVVVGNATGNNLSANSIYGNGGVGIDLGYTQAIRPNDGAKTAGVPNQYMDYPVFTSASLSGTTLSVAGYVGSLAGQATFAAARVEVFVSDALNANGQGKTYLGVLTAGASGNFSGTITGVSGVTAGSTRITATATDTGGNTSEFGPNLTVANLSIAGTVFEDVNYGGGAGRSLGASGGPGLAGATVELYDSSGTFVASTPTLAGGTYSFGGLSPASYWVRVVGGSVLSQRSGSTAALAGVMTWRADASSGTPVAVTNFVGGTNPALVDPGAAGIGAAFNTGTFVYGAGLTGTAQSVAPVTLTSAGVAGVDFGFNFDTVVNTNDSGAGSLRQVITNANALGGDASLAQAGRTAGVENIVFMISNGSTGGGGSLGLTGGLRTAYNFFGTAAGAAFAATITPATTLPAWTSALVVDAQTQPGWLLQPLIELRGGSAGSTPGLVLSAAGCTVRGLVINRFGGDGLIVTAGGGDVVQGNYIGTDAGGAAAAANSGSGISVNGSGSAHQIGGTLAAQRNVVSGNSGYGVYVGGSGGAHVVQGNYIGTSATGLVAVGNQGRGVFVDSGVASATLGGTVSGAGNVISGHPDYAVWLAGGATAVQGNLIGLNAAGTAALGNAYGVFTASGGHQIGGTSAAARNVVSGNTGRGLWLNSAGNTVQGNYIGTNAAGTAALPNQDGVYTKGVNNAIGGSAGGAGNLVSGNSRYGLQLNAIASGTLVQGNVVGLNAAGTAALANGIGIDVACIAGCTVGGTVSGQGNVVSGNSGAGVQVEAGAAGNAIEANAIYANGGIGIDLGADGATANDGAKTLGAANLLMDAPVITAARARGNQLTVAGYIGTAAGQFLFAGSRVEVFLSDASSGSGSGKTYLGALTADAGGNFSGTLTMVPSTVAAGSVLTATATDIGGNTSEFGANFASLVVDFVVNSNADADDANPGDGICQTATAGQCTLRAALTELNARAAQGSPPTIAFAIPGCSSGAQASCVITPAANLPTAARAVSVDATTQPGYGATPMIEINGGVSTAGAPLGLQLTQGGSSVRGLRFTGWSTANAVALQLSGSDNHVVEADWFGLAASGSATVASANRVGIALLASSGSRIGGSTSAQRNVISNSTATGLSIVGGTADSVLGNYIGTDASGLVAAGNAVGVTNQASATVVGGTAAGAGNLFAGNTTTHLLIDTAAGAQPAASATVQGNRFGLGAGGAVIASALDAVRVNAGVTNTVIGGTAAGAGNVITGSTGQGIGVVDGTGTRVTIEGNAIYGNTLLGIDLGRDGVSANDGLYTLARANGGMDQPVITTAGYNPLTRTLTVAGYVGTGTGQAIFAGARVELFTSDGDPSGYGEGSAFVGVLTADASGRFSGTVNVPSGVGFVVGTALTGTATDAAGNTSEFGANFISTTVAAMAPGRFNIFETGTLTGALTGVLQTRVAGVASSVAVIAIDSSGLGLLTGFTGSVSLDWMNASDNSGALDAGNCRSSWIATGAAGSAGSLSFLPGDLGRHIATITPTVVGREWRLRVTYAGPLGTLASCSTDPFAVRPASLAITGVTDNDDSTAGLGRSLNNLLAASGRVHRAGRPFSLRGGALDAVGALTAGYDGVPVLAATGCVLPATGCVPGVLTVPTLVASAGALAADTLSYSEVGAISLQLTDDTFAAIDAADTPLAQRRILSSVVSVGRFVPDHYVLAAANTPQFATQQGSCAQPGQGFTFVGQSFGWVTAPAFTVTAQNAAGATTAMWAGALQKLTPANGIPAPAIAAANAQGLAPTATWGAMTLADLGGGVARVSLGGDRFMFARDSSVPVASFNPSIAIGVAVSDTSELGTSGNTPVASSGPLAIGGAAGIGFDLGSTFDYARLKLQNAFGDVRYGVSAHVELQKYTTRGWMRLAEDSSCVTIPQPAIAFSVGSGAFATSVCSAPPAASIALRQGRGTLVLPRVPGNVQGAAMLTLNIGSLLEGSACVAGVPVAPTSALLAHLLGARGTGSTQDQNPAARLVWGRQHRDYIAQRELF